MTDGFRRLYKVITSKVAGPQSGDIAQKMRNDSLSDDVLCYGPIISPDDIGLIAREGTAIGVPSVDPLLLCDVHWVTDQVLGNKVGDLGRILDCNMNNRELQKLKPGLGKDSMPSTDPLSKGFPKSDFDHSGGPDDGFSTHR